MSHRTNKYATTFISDLRAKKGARVAVRAEKTNFHQFIAVQLALQFFEKLWTQTRFSYLECGLQSLPKAAQISFLRSIERKCVHFFISAAFSQVGKVEKRGGGGCEQGFLRAWRSR